MKSWKRVRLCSSPVMRLGVSLLLAGCICLSPLAIHPPEARAAAPSKLLPKGVTARTVKAVELGLKYLEARQKQDGSWDNMGGYGSYPVAMTSLAGLAFLASGSTPESGPYSKCLRRALRYILNMAEKNQRKGDKGIYIPGQEMESRGMYGHGFAMLFLAQCYGVEGGSKDSKIGKRMKIVLDGAVQLTAHSQSDLGAARKHAGGWTYSPHSKSDEGSVTVTQLQALRACRNVGIKVPKKTIDRAVYLLQYLQRPDGGIAYSSGSRGSSQPALSAAAMVSFYMAGIYDKQTGGKGSEAKMVEKLATYCKSKCMPNQSSYHFYYTQMFMAQAMYQRGGKDWKEYYPLIRDRLLGMQASDGNWSGESVGTVYGTAIATMILQLPYGYLPIMQR